MRNYQQIKQSVLKLGYKWYSRPNELNFIWERVDFIATNKFTDFCYICYLDLSGNEVVVTLPATTKPGLKGSLLEPTTVEGIKGTAIIESPQQVEKCHQFMDTDKEFSNYPYFRQRGKLNYWRDGNKDTIIDKVQRQLAKLFGTHWHRMSQNGTYGSGEVNNWSEGCMGWPEPELKKILDIIRRHVKLYGDMFTDTILNKENFI